jgi:hypothetical protein
VLHGVAIWPAVVLEAEADTTSVAPLETVGCRGLRVPLPSLAGQPGHDAAGTDDERGPGGTHIPEQRLATTSSCASSTASTTKASASSVCRSCAHRRRTCRR